MGGPGPPLSTPVGRSETTQQMSDHDVHPCVPRADTNGRHDGRHDGPTRGPVISRPSLSVGSRDKWANFDGRHLSASVVLCAAISTSMSEMHLSRQWRRKGGRWGSFPLWVEVQKLCNMCVLSLSWNFFVSHDKYIAKPSSKEPR